ncbi:MAG: hypothetical protein HOW73_37660 [Polyangiaceae bacterium]|nr:hypothetical protein [Polyangiaceae bacterium]
MKYRIGLLFGAFLAIGAASGCGDSGSGGSGGGDEGGGGVAEGGQPSTGGSDGTGGTGGAAETLSAPTLDEVMPMHGALHLYWTNITADCDAVEGERKEGDGTFANFFSVPGTVDNEADDAATDPAVTYTYRVRCMRGSDFSEYSNEVSASPEP